MMNPELSILIVDDNEHFRHMAYEIFEGYSKNSAENFEEGLDKFMKFKPDITLLDINMPDGNGLDLLEEMLSHNPEAYIVMLTSSNISKDVDLAKKRGANGYIIKPFSFNKVIDCVAKYYEHKEKLKKLSTSERAEKRKEKIAQTEENITKRKIQRQEELSKEEKHKIQLQKTIDNMEILFVDDYPTNREKAKPLLHNIGCNVNIAKSGEDSLRLVEKHNFDVIFLDSRMNPGMSGYDAARKIRKIERENNLTPAKIIAMVEFLDEIEEELWKESGMDSYIKKPTRFSALQQAINEHAEYLMEKTEK